MYKKTVKLHPKNPAVGTKEGIIEGGNGEGIKRGIIEGGNGEGIKRGWKWGGNKDKRRYYRGWKWGGNKERKEIGMHPSCFSYHL